MKVQDMNVYLAPIVDELNFFWRIGIEFFGVGIRISFIIEAILL